MDWYPWYPTLYKADTMHLSCLEDGAYRRLIDWYMETQQPLPDNDAALARIVGLSIEEWVPISATVRAFFALSDGKLHQKHCDREILLQDQLIKKRSAHAKHAASMRWASFEHAASMPGECSNMPQDKTRQDKTFRRPKKPEEEEKPNGIEQHVSRVKITDDGYKDARQVAPGWDVHNLEAQWRFTCGDTPIRYPDRAFVAFCKKHASTHRL